MISGARIGTIGKMLVGVGALGTAIGLGYLWESKRKRPEKTTGDAGDRYANDSSTRVIKQVTDGHVPTHIRDQKKLEAYLKRQTAVKIRNVRGIYVSEYLAENLGLVPHLSPKKVKKAIKFSLQTYALTHAPFGRVLNYKPGNNGGKPYVPETIILIPSSMVRKLNGTKAERIAFNSVLYHEMEGHVQEAIPGSKMIKAFLALGTFIYNSMGVRNPTKVFELAQKGMSDLTEFCAFTKQLDYLIVNFNFDKDPKVIDEDTRSLFSTYLPRHAIATLQLVRWESENTAGIALETYAESCIDDVSERTRVYVKRMLLKRLGSKTLKGLSIVGKVTASKNDLHLIGL